MKRILITGKNSYVGKCLANYLAAWPEQYSVDAVSVRGDEWKSMSFEGYDAVCHVAAIVHQESSKHDPAQSELYDSVNALLPAAVAGKAREDGVGQFLFLSTAAVYGLTAPFGKTVMITKDTPITPKDLYGASKAKAEVLLQELQTDAFHVSILRPPMIYGKDCRGNYQTLAKMAKKLPFFPKVSNRRSMLYIDNLTELIRLLIDGGEGGVFCPQNNEYVNTCDMVSEIARANGHSIVMIPGFSWALKLIRSRISAVDKAFGSLCYDTELSSYRENYCVKDFCDSILETEK